ncbi:protein OCTOPUS-like [Curcuma longa]|uniref:protein OCTOPUS-like n=1 Tax=Curcuma longa TaxID=136217 RepID=UPI003D9E3824
MTAEIERQVLHHHHLLQPQRRLPASTCDLHPGETVTGFCASCLRERLAGLEAPAGSAGRKSTSALRSVFQKVSSGAAPAVGPSFLRRSKSFSVARGGGGEGFSAQRPPAVAFEPQRRSCDVRGRSTLWSLFNQDDHRRVAENTCGAASSASVAVASNVIASKVECRNLGFPGPCVAPPFSETREEENEITPSDPVVLVVESSGEINEERNEEARTTELKLMKEHIDLDSQQQQQQAKKPPSKDLKEIASSFWLAASVFSKKLQKWRRKQKLKKQGGDATMRAEKPPTASRRFRDTQSEVAVDASGRRSCDTDPRFSLDAGRMSFDDPRFSWDEPRASWDGYLIGGRSVFPRLPPMLSVVEDGPTQAVQRSDYLIPVEEDTTVPGGSSQTRDYYLDSSSRRRRSLDRSASIREQPVEPTEPKPLSNGKVSPAAAMDFFQFNPSTLLDRDAKDWSSNSLRDDYSGSFESAFKDQRGASAKKSRRWSKAWNIWGLIQRRSSSRGEANIVERSLSESWPELRSSSFNNRMLRCNSSISSRHSFSGNAGYGCMKKNNSNSGSHYCMERNRCQVFSDAE